MPIYTREEITAEIGRWKDALKACATGKNYTIDGRQLTRYDLAEIRKRIDKETEKIKESNLKHLPKEHTGNPREGC